MQIEVRVYPLKIPVNEALATARVRIMFDDHYVQISEVWVRKSKGVDQVDSPYQLWCAFPSRSYKDRNGATRYTDIVKIDEKMRKEITETIVDRYLQLKGKSFAPEPAPAQPPAVDNTAKDDPPLTDEEWALDID